MAINHPFNSPKEVDFPKRSRDANSFGIFAQNVLREPISDFTRLAN